MAYQRSSCPSAPSTTNLASASPLSEAGSADAAAAALPASDGGDSDAKFVVDGAEGHELLWYATQELLYLIG